MPVGIHAVLVPRYVTRVVRGLVKYQGAINQDLLAHHGFDRIQQILVTYETIGPSKEQMQAVESPLWPVILVGNGLQLTPKKGYLVIGEHFDRKENAVAIVVAQLLPRETCCHADTLFLSGANRYDCRSRNARFLPILSRCTSKASSR